MNILYMFLLGQKMWHHNIQYVYLRSLRFASKANSGENTSRVQIRGRLRGVNAAGAGDRAENVTNWFTAHFIASAGPGLNTHRLWSSRASARAAIVPCAWVSRVSVNCSTPDKLEPGVESYKLSYYSPHWWSEGVLTPPDPPEIVFLAKLGIR